MDLIQSTKNSILHSESYSSEIYKTEMSLSEEKKESFEDYFDPKFPRWISILLLVIGLFGNTLCLIIFSKKSMRKNSTFIYLAFLSIVDLIVLTLGLGDIILISYFKFVLRNRSLILCRLVSFLIYAFTHLSSFILASVSIDRAIATNLINFSKIYCKPKTAYKIILINILLAVVINFHSLIFLGYETHLDENDFMATSSENITIDYINANNNIDENVLAINSHNNSKSKHNLVTKYQCASEQGTLYDKFLEPYFKWIDLLFYAIIPFSTMGICTFLIVRVLYRSNKRLNKSKNKHDTKKSIDQTQTGLLNNNNNNNNVSQNKKQINSRSNKALHLTYTLITLNCLFFCLVSPLVILLIVLAGKETVGINKIFVNIVYLLAYSNHSFNFILYGFSSPPFRESLFNMFGIKTKKNNYNNNVTTNCNNHAIKINKNKI